MKSNSSWRIRAVQILLGVAIVVALVIVRGTNAGNPPVHVTTDWSHRHLIFSAPKTLAEHIGSCRTPAMCSNWRDAMPGIMAFSDGTVGARTRIPFTGTGA